MPIRKPRRQTLQELAYPPVPAIGGKDLRADEALLGLSDWEIGDHSTRYPQSLLSSSFDGSRWGGSALGTSTAGSTVAYSSVGGSDVSRPGLTIPSSKVSEVSSGMSPTRSEATHHVRKKKPPPLGPEPSTPSAPPSTAPSSPPKSSVSRMPTDAIVRPGDIVPPDWSAAALSVIGSAPPSVVAPTPAPTSNVGSSTTSLTSNPPSSFKQPQNRRPSQPPPRVSSSGYSHVHSHSQPLISVPTLPPIAASPRTSVADSHANLVPSSSKPVLAQVVSASVVQPSSQPAPVPQGAASMTLQAALKDVSQPSPSAIRQEQANPSQPTSYTQPMQPTPPRSESSPSRSQLLQVPSSPHGFSSQSHPAPPSVGGSHVSGRSSQSSRALPVPPPRSAVSAANTAPQATSTAAGPPPSSIQVWRAGVMTSGPRGWGAPPPSSQPSQSNPSQSTYTTPAASIVAPAYSQPASYQPDPNPVRTHYQPAAPPPPTRSYSYDTPTSGLPIPSQLSTNLEGYVSSPDVSGRGGVSPVVGDPRPNLSDDGRPGLQRAPSKLRRKLTKNRGWVPNAPVAAAPAVSTPTAAPIQKTENALVPRSQLGPTRGSSPIRVIQSGGQALVPAQRAFIGSHRPAHERMLWGLPLDRDPRVRHAIAKIEGIKDAVVTFGAEQFVESKMRGAVICNVDYRAPGHPDDLTFDWITFKDAQKTLDPTLQKSVMRTDPASTVLVVIFLLSPSLNSLAIWRKSVAIDAMKFDRVLAYKVDKVKRETADRDKDMAIKH